MNYLNTLIRRRIEYSGMHIEIAAKYVKLPRQDPRNWHVQILRYWQGHDRQRACGAAAKSSDEFGRLAALYAQGQHDPAYDKNAFKMTFKGQAADSEIEKRKFKF
jgi:hypothetical protein